LRAAERLCIGQSNLSREIRALEDQIGVSLFYRTSRHTELTAVGERLLDHARRVLAAEEHARLAIGELKRSAKERLRIGPCERIAGSRIATASSTWRQTHSDTELQVVSRSGHTLLPEIETGLLDAGITAMRVTEPGMVTDRLWTDAWVAALLKGHALASGRTLELADLASHSPSLRRNPAAGVSDRLSITCQPSIHRSSSPSAPQRLSRS
jgi:DNA-binding transcriptional LysR family regulator